MPVAERSGLDGIRAVALKLSHSQATASPLVLSRLLPESFGSEVWIKVETVDTIGSVKLRGAFANETRERYDYQLIRRVYHPSGSLRLIWRMGYSSIRVPSATPIYTMRANSYCVLWRRHHSL